MQTYQVQNQQQDETINVITLAHCKTDSGQVVPYKQSPKFNMLQKVSANIISIKIHDNI